MLRKKTAKRMMKMHLDNVQVSEKSIENMQEGINEFVEVVCRTARELLDEYNSRRKIQHLDARKRISEDEVSEAIRKIISLSNHTGNNLHASEVEQEVVGNDA
jgi:histone H3/H4